MSSSSSRVRKKKFPFLPGQTRLDTFFPTVKSSYDQSDFQKAVQMVYRVGNDCYCELCKSLTKYPEEHIWGDKHLSGRYQCECGFLAWRERTMSRHQTIDHASLTKEEQKAQVVDRATLNDYKQQYIQLALDCFDLDVSKEESCLKRKLKEDSCQPGTSKQTKTEPPQEKEEPPTPKDDLPNMTEKEPDSPDLMSTPKREEGGSLSQEASCQTPLDEDEHDSLNQSCDSLGEEPSLEEEEEPSLEEAEEEVVVVELSQVVQTTKRCLVCGKVLTDPAGHLEEKLSRKAIPFSCGFCDGFFSSSSFAVQNHIFKNHDEELEKTGEGVEMKVMYNAEGFERFQQAMEDCFI